MKHRRRRQVMLAALIGAVVSAGGAWAQDLTGPRNQCRASCGATWVKEQACVPVPNSLEPVSPAACRKLVDKRYEACLTGCLTYDPSPAAQAEDELGVRLGSAAAPWVTARLDWLTLPSRAPAVTPHAFAVPTQASAYGAGTEPLRVGHLAGPAWLRIDLTVTAGSAGILLTTADGSKALSPDRIVEAGKGSSKAYFRLTSDMAQPIVIIRNAGREGSGGAVLVNGAEIAREADLSPEALAEAKRGS